MNNTNTKIIPLDSQHGPAFPVETLPPVLRDYVQDVALSYQVPVDLPAVLALATCSAVIGKQYSIQVKPDWREACNLYTMIAMPPASRKSPVFKSMTSPLLAVERRYIEEHQQQMAEVEQKKNPVSLPLVRFESFEEGTAAQILHIGPFSEEGPTIEKLHRFIDENGGQRTGKHHEIYLSDIRRAAPKNWKTVIRQPMS